jgi:glucosyl-3-phosphoglycerate synthase
MSPVLRTFHSSEFPAEQVLASKHGRRVSVVLPARNEESTVGLVVALIHNELVERHAVVDELVVIDDGSIDDTAAMAEAAGATVIAAADVLPEYGTEHGKGQALWRGLASTTGDLVAYCDTDIRNLDVGFILGLVGPLLQHDDIDLVKGFYERPLDGQPGQGGRVTELVARPLIALLFPHLAPLIQPLAGEFAARRGVLEAVPFVGGYGVDLALLIDVAERFGPRVIAQCDLGTRVHRNRSLHELGAQSLEIITTVLSRAGFPEGSVPRSAALAAPGAEPVLVTLEQRPPLCEVPSHRKTA